MCNNKPTGWHVNNTLYDFLPDATPDQGNSWSGEHHLGCFRAEQDSGRDDRDGEKVKSYFGLFEVFDKV